MVNRGGGKSGEGKERWGQMGRKKRDENGRGKSRWTNGEGL